MDLIGKDEDVEIMDKEKNAEIIKAFNFLYIFSNCFNMLVLKIISPQKYVRIIKCNFAKDRRHIFKAGEFGSSS
jgi:hypothetical protein